MSGDPNHRGAAGSSARPRARPCGWALLDRRLAGSTCACVACFAYSCRLLDLIYYILQFKVGGAVLKDSLKECLNQGGAAMGMWLNDVYMVDLAAHMGFDWFMVDQMFTPTDWDHADRLLRAGEAAGITPVLRLQSNPWLGYNSLLARDLTRALGIGYQYIMVSNSGKREMEECAQVARDWHRKALWVHPFSSMDEWPRVTADLVRDTHVIPQP